MKSYVVHLIRHGITQGNLLGQYIGSTDSPLAEQGIADLYQKREEGSYPQAEAYFVSPLTRCRQTLEILYPGVNAIVMDDLRECDFGEWEGRTADELSTQDPRFAEWLKSGAAMTPPGGEGGDVFMQRTCAAFEKLVEGLMKTGTQSAVIVAHGGTLMSILSAYGLPKAGFYDWITDNGCGYSLRITPGLWMRSMVAEVFATIPPNAQLNEREAISVAREAASKAFERYKPSDDEN